VASTELPQPDRLITSMLKEKSAPAPEPIAACEQVAPEALVEQDQAEDPDRPSIVVPTGSARVAVIAPVAAVPGLETSTVTTAVTPRLSRPLTATPTLSLAAATVVVVRGVGEGLGEGVGEDTGGLVG
jgi:hypothetical protein